MVIFWPVDRTNVENIVESIQLENELRKLDQQVRTDINIRYIEYKEFEDEDDWEKVVLETRTPMPLL